LLDLQALLECQVPVAAKVRLEQWVFLGHLVKWDFLVQQV
jgi:hypothetical protein